MKKILVCSRTRAGAEAVCSLVSVAGKVSVTCAPSAVKAKGLCTAEIFDAVVIDSPLSDGLGDELISYIAKNSPSGIVFLADEKIYGRIESKCSGTGAAVLKKPVPKAAFTKALDDAMASKIRSQKLFEENEKLRKSIEELKLIDTAKCVLIEYLKLSEPQAHRYIEKQAMDLRKTKSEIAADILNTYKI
jgi:AmiR/NasT family two-component response regulator